MLFDSFHFAAFFPVVLLGVALAGRRLVVRNVLLLLASYYFYAIWDWRFLGLLLLTTLFDFGCGRLLDPGERAGPILRWGGRHRKAVLAFSVAASLTVLGFFKYCDFFVGSVTAVLSSWGLDVNLPALNVILPVGISFYTFQSMSYTIDVYRGTVRAEPNLLNYSLYVAFFPQLVAGPIERAGHMLPQYRTHQPITWEKLYSGFYLVGWGLLKKVVLADNLASVADAVFKADSPAGLSVLLGSYAFAFQIYCDFSAYSDIARGAARMLGFDIMVNFNLPYFSTNPSEFWRRWHISLSSWLRDYLYIPLGGNRRGQLLTSVNLWITMLLGGLWHGAGATYLVWGAYHAFLLWAHRRLQPVLKRFGQARSRALGHCWWVIRCLVFFHLVCLGWLVFRAKTLADFFRLLGGLLDGWRWNAADLGPNGCMILCACLLALLAVQIVQAKRKDLEIVLRLPAPARTVLYAMGMLAFVLFGEFGGAPFIYFQF